MKKFSVITVVHYERITVSSGNFAWEEVQTNFSYNVTETSNITYGSLILVIVTQIQTSVIQCYMRKQKWC